MKILSIGQRVALDGARRVVNHFVVQLEDGTKVEINTTEETVNQLMRAVGALSAEVATSVPPAPPAAVEPDSDPGELIGELVSPTADEGESFGLGDAPRPRHPPIGPDGYAIRPRSRTVPKDSLGYPIVSSRPIEMPEDEDGTQI